MPNSQKGLVYTLTNPAMPGLVKIGQTTNEITSRMNELNTTGVPLPFECLFACEVDDCKVVENALHKAFYPNRVNPRREFFEIDWKAGIIPASIINFLSNKETGRFLHPDQATAILRLFAKKDVTSAITTEINKSVSTVEKEASENYKKRRPH